MYFVCQIHYSVSIKSEEKGVVAEKKTLLHSQSGEALPGELLGIMGTSGAGTITLHYPIHTLASY